MSPAVSVRLLLTQSDARLVAFARSGHERAFEALLQRYRRPLHNYCRRLLLSDERAEDALQQALLQAWLALRAGTEVGDVKPWLYRIVHNAAVNALRVSGYDYCKLNESLTGAGAPQEDLDRRIAVREALAGLAALPEMQREALLRTAVEGRTHQQVARDLGLSENALRGLVYRARSTLRAAAGAITPSPLVSWALGATRGTPVVERLAELGAGGGSAGLAGLLMKGGAVAVTASVLAGGIVTGHRHHPKATAKRTAAHASRSTVAPVAVASAHPARWTAPAGTSEHGGSSYARHTASHASHFTRRPHHRERWHVTPSPTPPNNIWSDHPHRDGGDTHRAGSKDGTETGGDVTHHRDTSGGGGDSHGSKDGGLSAASGESREGTSSSSTGEHDGERSGDRTGSGDQGSTGSHDGSKAAQTNTDSSGSQATSESSKEGQTTTTEETVKHD